MTEENTRALPDNVEVQAFHLGFYIPDADVTDREFSDYYDRAIAGNLKPVEGRKGKFTQIAGGTIIGGYMLSSQQKGTLYGPNGSIADTVEMVENAIANSGMPHGYVMFYLFTDDPEWESLYFLMSPGDQKLRAVSMAEYVANNQPWNINVFH
jgi:hypothetical protein